jgi:hypothetical protein
MRQARRVLTGDVFDDLVGELGDRTPKNLDKVEEVPIDKFLSEVLPRVDTIEVLVENRHAGNFVSLVAPSDPSPDNCSNGRTALAGRMRARLRTPSRSASSEQAAT